MKKRIKKYDWAKEKEPYKAVHQICDEIIKIEDSEEKFERRKYELLKKVEEIRTLKIGWTRTMGDDAEIDTCLNKIDKIINENCFKDWN